MISRSKRLGEVLEDIRVSTHRTSSKTLRAIVRQGGENEITKEVILNRLTNWASAVHTTEGLGFSKGTKRTVGVEEVAAIFTDTRSPVGRETTKSLLHQVKVLEVLMGVVQETASSKLVNNAAHRPHVSREHPTKAEDNFRRAVVAGGDDGRAGVVLIATASEIADADAAGQLGDSAASHGIRDEFGRLKEAVLRLQIGVHEAESGVHEVQTARHVEDNFSQVAVGEGAVFLEVI